MLRIILASAFLFIQVIFANAFQQVIKKDTVWQDSVNLSFRLLVPNKLSDAYLKRIDDSTELQFSSGISMINSLRGQLPNLTISANAYNAVGDVRLGNTSFMLDGIPFHSSSTRLMPINAFDYRSITVFSNPNALTAIDGITDGAILLESKSGRGYGKPAFEVNSYTTYGKFDFEQLDPIFYFTNSLAYAQDFGKVNTRVSYTWNASNSDYKFRNPLSHTLNTNTGFLITPKFTAQVITNANRQRQKPHPLGGVFPSTTTYNQDFLNASLLLRYQFTGWLYIASKANVSQENYDQKTEDQNLIERKYDNVRQIVNLFLNYDQNFGRLNAKMYAGIQNTSQRSNATLSRDGFVSGSYEAKVNSPAFAAGTAFIFDNLLSINGNLRISEYSSLPDEQNQKKNYSFGISFLPSSLIKWHPLSLAKVRATYGVRSPWAFWNYPQMADPQNSSLNAGEKNYVETGIDLSFLNKRINFTANYFNNIANSNALITNGGTGSVTIINNVGDLRTSGTELIISGVPVISSTLNYHVSVLWSTCNIEVESIQNSNSNFSLGSSFPDWRASLYNAVTWRGLTMSFLLDASEGGVGYSLTPTSRVIDSSFIKLRDLSIGYWLPVSMIDKLGLSKLWLSTSFRNPIIYTQDGYDAESTLEAQKTISLNLYASF